MPNWGRKSREFLQSEPGLNLLFPQIWFPVKIDRTQFSLLLLVSSPHIIEDPST